MDSRRADLCANWGGSRACSGSRLDPSPIEAKDLCFWFLMDLINPLTVTLSASTGGECSRCATDCGAVEYARAEE